MRQYDQVCFAAAGERPGGFVSQERRPERFGFVSQAAGGALPHSFSAPH